MKVEDFWSKVDKDGPVHPVLGTACWVWTGRCEEFGHGRLAISRGVHRMAHRVAWEIANGPIPEAWCVLHGCDNPPCVRPDHLFLGTKVDNVRDMDAKGRRATGDRNGARVHPERRPRGDKFAKKLTAEKALQMRARRAGGATYKALAIEFGVSEAMVWQVVTDRKWRDLDRWAR